MTAVATTAKTHLFHSPLQTAPIIFLFSPPNKTLFYCGQLRFPVFDAGVALRCRDVPILLLGGRFRCRVRLATNATAHDSGALVGQASDAQHGDQA